MAPRKKIDNPDVTGNPAAPPLSPLKRLAAQLEVAATDLPQEVVVKEADVSGIFTKLDWTLGQLKPGSDEYRYVLDTLAPNDSGLTYDRENFLNLLATSLSLSTAEKRRVLTELSFGLSQEQVDALIATFEDERNGFYKLMSTEQSNILQMYLNAMADWAEIYMGMGLSNNVMANVVNGVLHGEDSAVPAVFRRDSNFWQTLSDLAILWGLNDGLVTSIVARGTITATQEESERPFVLDLMNSAYRTNLYSVKAPRAYIQRRARLFSDYIKQITDKEHQLVVFRAYILGLCEDYFLLNQVQLAKECVAHARDILETLKAESEENTLSKDLKKAMGLLASAELTLATSPEQEADLQRVTQLLKVMWKHSPPLIVSNPTLITLSLMQQGDLCCNLLAQKIQEKPDDALEAAMHLLVFGKITENDIAVTVARKTFVDILPSSLEKIIKVKHKRSLNSLVHRYAETMVFLWLSDASTEEQETITRLWQDATAGNGFHYAVRSPKPGSKRSPDFPGFKYWLISSLEEKMNGGSDSVSDLKHSLKEYWQLHHALVILYGLSSNPSLRPHCQELAHSLMSFAQSRLFGFPLGDNWAELFAPFAKGKQYAGSYPLHIQQWRGQLVYEDLFS